MSISATRTVNDSLLTDKQLLMVAKQYQHGIIREANPRKAAHIYSALVKKGNTRAMNELGKMYLNGDGVKRNPQIALRLFKKASALGDTNAKCNLALMYQKGENGVINFKKAYKLYKEAADSGSAQGLYGAGHLQYKGLGVKQDYKAAIELLEKGAKKKHPGCDFLLASYYANGFGGKDDFEKAEKHYRRASKNGNSWTVDVTKNNLLDSIQSRHHRKGQWKHVKEHVIPQNGMRMISKTIDAHEIEGEWRGKVYTYDWSRNTILGEQDVNYIIKCNGDSVNMKYYVGDSLVSSFIAFKKGAKYSTDLKNIKNVKFPWIVTNAKFEKKGRHLFATFNSLNIKNMGMRKPMLAVFERKQLSTSEMPATFEIIKAEMTGEKINVLIKSEEDKNIDISLSGVYGMNIKKLGTKKICKGNNKLTIDALPLKKGFYVVNASCKDERHSSKITVNNNE